MTDGYLSKDAAHLAKLQRERRARMVRIDYMPGDLAAAIIAAKREQARPGTHAATNSALLDAIVTEWAELTGIKWSEVSKPMTSTRRPEFSDTSTRGRMTSGNGVGDGKCGARRHRDGQPCQAKPEPGKRRCRFHGGKSTGPKTEAGRLKASANLRRGHGCRGSTL